MTLLAQQLLLLQGQLVLVIAVEVAPEEEGEFGVLLLLLHRHLLELGPVPRHELRQFVDDIPQLLVVGRQRHLHGGGTTGRRR